MVFRLIRVGGCSRSRYPTPSSTMSDDVFSQVHQNINDAELALVEKLGKKLGETERRLTEMEQRFRRLALKCEVVIERSGLKDAEIEALVKEREKKHADTWYCAQCGKVLRRGFPTCAYCGTIDSRRRFEG